MRSDGRPWHGGRVLVCDDNLLMADVVAEFLRDCGLEPVGPVGRLETAMHMARDRALDGAILDINLNGRPCFPICAILSNHHALAANWMRNGPHHLTRRLVLALALIRDLPQQVILGPGEVGHLNDHLWPHPMHARQLERSEPAVTGRRFSERHFSYVQRRQHACQAL